MRFDVIVFKQNELENAIKTGIASIALCDNDFILPPVGSIAYTAIGSINAEINMTEEDFYKLNIICNGFTPIFSQNSAPASVISPLMPCASFSSGYVTSYLLSSYFITSYSYRYEYEFGTSFSTSYITSYVTSYTTSYTTSYSASFRMPWLRAEENPPYEYEEKCIMVNGYGINLI